MAEKANKRKKDAASGGAMADLALTQIIRAAADKDPAAMAELFERTRRHLYYYAYMMTGNTADAEDLLQEAYIKCILSLDTLQSPDAFYAWMWTILKNLRANSARRNRLTVMSSEQMDAEENRVLEGLIDDADTPEKLTEKKELAGILRHMIHALPEEQKEVVLLHYYDELTLSEIAKIQDCPLATVKSRLLYAKKSLRAAIRLEEEKSGVALHSTLLIPVYPAILARLSALISLSADSAFSIFMNVAAFFGVTCSGDTVRLLGTTTTDEHPIRDKAYVIRVRIAPIVAAGMALCIAIGFGAGKAFTRTNAVPMETVTETMAESVEASDETSEAETDSTNQLDAAGRRLYPYFSLIGTYGFNKAQIEVGQTFAMQYLCIPFTTTQQQMEIVCPDEDIVEIRGKQIVGVSPGKTRIFFFNPYNRELRSSYGLTVVEAKSDPIPVESIQFNTNNLNNLLPGDVFSLNYQTVPALTEVTEFSFTSDDPTVAVYDGVLLNALSPGTTTIRALRAVDGEELGSIEITVYASAEDFPKVRPKSVEFYSLIPDRTIRVGDHSMLVYYINPGTAGTDSYYYTVSDPDVLSFDGEYIDALSAGKSYITFIRTEDNTSFGSILYTVLP